MHEFKDLNQTILFLLHVIFHEKLKVLYAMFSLRNLISARCKSIRKAFVKTISARRGAINQKRRQ